MESCLIYGAGTSGRNAYTALDGTMNVLGFIDADIAREGDTFCNLPIYSLRHVVAEGWQDTPVYIALTHPEDVADYLHAAGMTDVQLYVPEEPAEPPTYAIYGAGDWGHMAYTAYQDSANIVCFLDRAKWETEKELFGRPITPPSWITEHPDTPVIIAVEKCEGIAHDLLELGAQHIFHYMPGKPLDAFEFESGEGESAAEVPYYRRNYPEARRLSIDEAIDRLSAYDVISFDIFDTAIYRNVEYPADVFALLARKMKNVDFENLRSRAEDEMRKEHEKATGTREITLADIYDRFADRYGIERRWMKEEIALELALCEPNPYIQAIYQGLIARGKTVIFMTDMYLPEEAIARMLAKCGYTGYAKLYLSNVYGLNKGDMSMQLRVREDYPGKFLAHVGDNRQSDINRSRQAGYAVYYCPDPRFRYHEDYQEGPAGTVRRAILQNRMNCGLWDKNLSYTHGFRVGGILAAGYAMFIHAQAEAQGAEKILFCARDCDVLYRSYQKMYPEDAVRYIEISRRAILSVSGEKHFYDYLNRGVLRHFDQCRSTKTLATILEESGMDYLVDLLAEDGIEKYTFPCSLYFYRDQMTDFCYRHRDIILAYLRESHDAAKAYFGDVLGDARRILVADIGWTGTCITALRDFLLDAFPERGLAVTGTICCSSRSREVRTAIESGLLRPYTYSPLENIELARFMFPARTPVEKQERLHMPLEYLFTSTAPSLLAYAFDDDGRVAFRRVAATVPNPEEIEDMQRGMLDFVDAFWRVHEVVPFAAVPGYTAFWPLKSAIEHEDYCCDVYGNFLYDAMLAPGETGTARFRTLFPGQRAADLPEAADGQQTILFVTPELTYTGTPRSLLRMANVAVTLGYRAIVWSAKPGPFAAEYEACGIPVEIVPPRAIDKERRQQLASYHMAVCNTIVTDPYVRIVRQYLPTVWYIREATNIPDFCRNDRTRLAMLRHSRELYCVSDYARDAIQPYAAHPVHVVKNCVEDEVQYAMPYRPGTGETVKFVQFGTMEYRKGYDVLIAAYEQMPERYRAKSELYFAGGFINSGTPFCSWIFPKIEADPHIHYLGVVRGEEKKIQTLSSMDVIVVASRDESCSLVALEGAMLSRPLIVTENVGAKYMVTPDDGYIVKTGDAASLAKAMMDCIDRQAELAKMGEAARVQYEQQAGMDAYTEAMKELYAMAEDSETYRQKNLRQIEAEEAAMEEAIAIEAEAQQNPKPGSVAEHLPVIVSMTSHPGRISTVDLCIRSLLDQTALPEHLLLWLSTENFPGREVDLPETLAALAEEHDIFEIRWVDGDTKPHKKYLHTMQEYPDLPVIIVDDDVACVALLVENLWKSYEANPHCISAMRTNLMMFGRDGEPLPYTSWTMDYKALRGVPSYALIPTGVGGVLYPPHAIAKEAFDIDAIHRYCPRTDDIWLKLFAVKSCYPTVLCEHHAGNRQIAGTQDVALWKENVKAGGNDAAVEKALEYFETAFGDREELLRVMKKDRFC